MFIHSVSVAALAIGLASSAFASDTAPATPAVKADSAEAPDQEIVVTGQRPEYGARTTSTATRTSTDIKDVPQAMTVISESQIEDQALRSMSDILTFVPGAMAGTGEGNRDQFSLRGNNSTADFFIDGIRDDVQYSRDLYNADRIEVLRGPNAMIFGRGGGGGVINRVTKRSSLNEYREFAAQADSEAGYRLTGDIDQPLGAGAGLRVNGMYEDGESFRDGVELERYAVNPTAGILVGPNTRIDLGYEYLHDRRTTDRGVPAFNDRPLEDHDSTFFGDPDLSYALSDVHIGTFAIHHQLGEGLSIRNRTFYGDYDKFYQNVFPSNLLEATNEVQLGAYNSVNDRKNLFTQTDLVWETNTGGVGHTLLLGFELGRQKSFNFRQSGTFAGSSRVPLSDPTIDADVTFAPAASDANNRTKANVAAIYVQDQIRLSSMFEIVAGLRFDRFGLTVNDQRGAGAMFERTDELLSPRLGLIAKPNQDLSLYTSYSRSYLPSSGDQFGGLDVTSAALKPEKFDNYEIGAKWEPLEGLLATAAIYQLDRSNTRAPNPDGSGTVVLTGAQRSRGIELGLERSISDRWQVSAGYAYQDAEISRTTSAAPEGRKIAFVPRHQFSMWNRYDVTPKLGVGLGVVARSKTFASISNAVTLPGYARVDAALFYELVPGVEAQVNVENLLGADYFSTAHSDNNIAPGAPATARGTLRFRF